MRPQPEGLVGDDAARSVHGLSSGSDVARLGAGADLTRTDALQILTPVGAELVIDDPSSTTLLAALADLAGASDRVPLVVVAADLDLSLPAGLDLLDSPGVATGALTVSPTAVSQGVDRLSPVRVGGDGRLLESVGTISHIVTCPNAALPGMLRVAPADRAAAAAAWRRATALPPAADLDPFAVAVLALVRTGIPVQAVPLGPFAWSRAGVIATGSGGSAWQQRLRGASRGGDGFVSTYAVRPLSRKVTRIGLRLGWSPNAVTAVSLVLGVLAAVLVTTGSRWAWLGGAFLLQASLIIDCVDGEIARFTRRFSAFGAFLDAVGDRVKEYSVFAALAAVAARTGDHPWTLAIVAMALVTIRHLENYAYEHRLVPRRLSRPDLLALDQGRDGGPAEARTSFAPPPSRRRTVAKWAKNIIHMPIAERYLLISLGLLTGDPNFVLWLVVVCVSLSLIWTQGGRTVKALNGRDGVVRADPRAGWGHLDLQLDLGPVARLFGRAARLPFLAACLTMVMLAGVAAAMVVQDRAPLAFLAVLLAALVTGAGARPPVAHVMDWQLPALLWSVEALVIAAVAWAHLQASQQGLAFAFLAAVAYHRYDVVYRLRDTGEPAAVWLTLAGLGFDGRLIVVVGVAAWAPDAVAAVLGAGAVWLTLLYLAESTVGWRRWIMAQRPTTETTSASAAGVSA